MKFKGTLAAVIIIILIAIAMRLSESGNLIRREVVVEPTEDMTLGFLENTHFGTMPAEN